MDFSVVVATNIAGFDEEQGCDEVGVMVRNWLAIRGIVLAPETDERSSSDLLQRDEFQPSEGTRGGHRPLTGTMEVASVGIARTNKGRRDTCWEKICEILRKISNGMTVK